MYSPCYYQCSRHQRTSEHFEVLLFHGGPLLLGLVVPRVCTPFQIERHNVVKSLFIYLNLIILVDPEQSSI